MCAKRLKQMREKLALTGDGLSESMREASLGRRELEQASLTIMQVLHHSCACLPFAPAPAMQSPQRPAARERERTCRCAWSCQRVPDGVREVKREVCSLNPLAARAQMDAKIRLLSSAGAASEEKLDIRIARERVMMHQVQLHRPATCACNMRLRHAPASCACCLMRLLPHAPAASCACVMCLRPRVSCACCQNSRCVLAYNGYWTPT